MKFQLSVSDEHYEPLKAYLDEHGIVISDDPDYIISETARFPAFLSVRNFQKERVRLSVTEVVFIEAFGKDIEVQKAKKISHLPTAPASVKR